MKTLNVKTLDVRSLDVIMLNVKQMQANLNVARFYNHFTPQRRCKRLVANSLLNTHSQGWWYDGSLK